MQYSYFVLKVPNRMKIWRLLQSLQYEGEKRTVEAHVHCFELSLKHYFFQSTFTVLKCKTDGPPGNPLKTLAHFHITDRLMLE